VKRRCVRTWRLVAPEAHVAVLCGAFSRLAGSCGCLYDGDSQSCSNAFPDCPALGDQGNNFGFSFFNDHHFHLGYHLYAAAGEHPNH